MVVEFNSGPPLLLREFVNYEPNVNDKYHTVTRTDRIDLIASRYYSGIVEDASKFWWVVADANGIMEPLSLEEYIGKTIIIPDILRVLLLLD